MNKKALTFNMIVMIPRIIFLIIVILSVVILVNAFLINKIDVRKPIEFTFVTRANNALSYFDSETSRLYPGTIDLRKFDDDFLAENLNFDNNNQIAAKITLKDFDNGGIKEIYYNKTNYDRFKVVPHYIPGPGGYHKNKVDYYVLIKESDNTKQGIIKFEVLMKR